MQAASFHSSFAGTREPTDLHRLIEQKWSGGAEHVLTDVFVVFACELSVHEDTTRN